MLASSRWRRSRAVRCASTPSTRTLARASRSVLQPLCSVRRRAGRPRLLRHPSARPVRPLLLSGPRPDALSRHLSPPRLLKRDRASCRQRVRPQLKDQQRQKPTAKAGEK